MNTTSDIKREVLVRLQGDTAMAFFTDTILDDWLDNAHKWAAGRNKWVMTQGANETTFVTGTEKLDYPEGFRTNSINYLEIGDKRLQRITFEDYQRFKESSSSATDKVFASLSRTLYLNTAADVSGTMVAYGQFIPLDFDRTDNTAKTIFSDEDEDGNEAIILKMISFAKQREGKKSEAKEYENDAKEILGNLSASLIIEESTAHTKDRGMFKRFDLLEGLQEDNLFKRDQF